MRDGAQPPLLFTGVIIVIAEGLAVRQRRFVQLAGFVVSVARGEFVAIHCARVFCQLPGVVVGKRFCCCLTDDFCGLAGSGVVGNGGRFFVFRPANHAVGGVIAVIGALAVGIDCCRDIAGGIVFIVAAPAIGAEETVQLAEVVLHVVGVVVALVGVGAEAGATARLGSLHQAHLAEQTAAQCRGGVAVGQLFGLAIIIFNGNEVIIFVIAITAGLAAGQLSGRQPAFGIVQIRRHVEHAVIGAAAGDHPAFGIQFEGDELAVVILAANLAAGGVIVNVSAIAIGIAAGGQPARCIVVVADTATLLFDRTDITAPGVGDNVRRLTGLADFGRPAVAVIRQHLHRAAIGAAQAVQA